MKMGFLFTSESVSEGHPDKVSDQISDAILDEFLRRDANSKVACETLCTTGLVVVAGEVRSEAYVDVQGVARRVINRIGYTRSDYMFAGNYYQSRRAEGFARHLRFGVAAKEFVEYRVGYLVRDFVGVPFRNGFRRK